jgi:hypothetical protein
MRAPSGLNVALLTYPEWPLRVAILRPVAASQSRGGLLGYAVVTMRAPSGLNEALLTDLECPREVNAEQKTLLLTPSSLATSCRHLISVPITP